YLPVSLTVVVHHDDDDGQRMPQPVRQVVIAVAEDPALVALQPAEIGVTSLDLQADVPPGNEVVVGHDFGLCINSVVRQTFGPEHPPQFIRDNVVDTPDSPFFSMMRLASPHPGSTI